MSNEAKAAELMAEAERKLKSSQGFLGGIFGWVRKCSIIYDYKIFMSFVYNIYLAHQAALGLPMHMVYILFTYATQLPCFERRVYIYRGPNILCVKLRLLIYYQ
jgi:hypothetical protein